MDERQESNQNQQQNSKPNQTQGGKERTQATPNVNTLLDESPLPRPAVEWIKCLRAPAMSLSITMDKRHIPNYDAAGAEGNEGSESNASGASEKQAESTEGMSFSHRCTVRYFDLALGAVAVMLLGCLCKTCTGCKRMMKRWF
jgi:hypothetical protein